ncbi:bicaudal D-related protein homolog [Lepeophtheirus salmonis]|nr:bicaudal D-related protein homolog [Lepeophtheirus salmonis]XP_040578911.1 bicaudal D-related protein homolog [Lepeophtheirus salmonis]XP_040578912.1 bicaudal D-related protein homolog [Lepeophtheirus salmonis]
MEALKLSRPASSSGNMESGVFSAVEDASEDIDVYALLAQKERDLVLAAELGKALLDKNEEISKQNELIAEDFSQKLEELEQEKYHLRRRLENAVEEYELRIQELQSDISHLRLSLEEQESLHKQNDKEKSLVILTMTEQNQRLTNQLKENSKNEESMLSDMNTLKSQISQKRSSMNDHVSHLDMLREEINLLNQRKIELERRIEFLTDEREGLSTTLDESADRILMLEKQSREQNLIIRSNELSMEELQNTNLALANRLDSMCRSLSLSPHCNSSQNGGGTMSLLNEMEISDSEKSMNVFQGNIDDEIDIEVDDETIIKFNQSKEAHDALKAEIHSVHKLLTKFCQRLKQEGQARKSQNPADPQNDDSGIEWSEDEELRLGNLGVVVNDLKGIIHGLLRKNKSSNDNCCPNCGSSTTDEEKRRLETLLHRTNESFEKLERTLKQKEEETKRRDEEIVELKSKLSVTEVKLSATEEERDYLKEDLSRTDAGKDELIRKAWDVRDAAVKRKTNTEIELARSRIDVMQINSQLLESIRQKVELSKQLEQWQVDMEELLEEQMSKKMKAHEGYKKKLYNNQRPSVQNSEASRQRKRSNIILSFFQR